MPIFNEWIRERALGDLVMLDEADYAHIPESPGIMLICREVTFSMDRTDERFGLLALRARSNGRAEPNTGSSLSRPVIAHKLGLVAHRCGREHQTRCLTDR